MSNFLKIYNEISYLEKFADRASRGSMGEILETGEGWLLKTDKSGIEGCRMEHYIYEHMQSQGHQFAPECALEMSEITTYPGTIVIKKINNGATLRDYIEAYLNGLIPAKVTKALMESTGKLLKDFWEKGYTHRDLHPRNIVVGLNKKGDQWKPYLIDFSTTTHESQEEQFKLLYNWQEELATQKDDIDTLIEEIRELVDEPPSDFEEVLASLNI